MSLPFKYLGVSIMAKKITAKECNTPVEKLTSRIRTWSTRSISFAGRVTLVNTVLITIHTYWSQIFMLPKRIIKEINAIFSAFLWTWNVVASNPRSIAWDSICKSKSEGGLGMYNSLV